VFLPLIFVLLLAIITKNRWILADPLQLSAFGMPRGPRHGPVLYGDLRRQLRQHQRRHHDAAAPSYAFRDVDHHHQPECNVHNAATAQLPPTSNSRYREVTLATRGPKTHAPRISLQICREGGPPQVG